MSSVFEPDRLLALPPRVTVATHGPRDVILYALGVGVGIDDATGPQTLRHAYERDLAVPCGEGVIYVNLTGLVADFKGDVKVGVKGRVKRVLWEEVLIQ